MSAALATALAVSLAAAGPPAPSPLTLDEAVASALAHRPTLAQARAQAAAAEAQSRAARGALLPQLDAAARYAVSHDEAAGGGPVTTGDSTSGSLSASQLLLDFGRTRSRWRSARAAADAAREDAEATRHDVVLEARLAFFGLLQARALEDVAAATLANEERHLAQTEEMVKLGTRASIDLARLRTAVASSKASLERARGDTRAARARLQVAMGVPPGPEIVPARPELPPLAAEDEPATALVAEAARARPELASLRATIESQGYAVAAAERALWPSLRLGGDASFAGTDPSRPSWGTSIGVTLSWPIFDGLSSPATADAERARLLSDRARLDDEGQRVWQDIEDALAGVASARAQLPAAEEGLAAARDLLGLAEARYAEGVGDALELADAELQLATAAAQRVQVEYGLAAARAQLLRALGRDAWR